MKQQWSLKKKLIFTFLGVGLVPLLVSSGLSYMKSSGEIMNQASERVKITGSEKAESIVDYFDNEKSTLIDFSDLPIVQESLVDFSKTFEKYSKTELTSEEEKKLERYYVEEFGKKYRQNNPESTYTGREAFQQLDVAARAAQYDFIANNPNPLGEKNKMDLSAKDTPYAKLHEKIHPKLRNFADHHSFYDLFLVNKEGRVVYTVFKETDFATSLTQGPWANSGLANAFKAVKKLADNEMHLEDFESYTPSYEGPASFLSTPIYQGGEFIGALISQLPLEKISKIIDDRAGLNQMGQVVVIGRVGRLRGDLHRSKETYNVAASFSAKKILVTSPALEKAKEGKTGVMSLVSHDGVKTISYYAPIKIFNIEWYMATELAEEEVFAGLQSMNMWLIAIILISAAAIGLVAWTMGGSISKNIQGIIDHLAKSSQEVQGASLGSAASATELSEAATEQAASLQETMASIEQISAMVNQNAESATKAKQAGENNQKASEEGKRAVGEMIRSIGEIKQTNDEILAQMEKSNREFGDIVKIISDIGEKTKVINDIVFQTKLLSFNASVEAARAGEHGKGFAVVAEEVGNLAQMSGNAAKQITDMLTDSIRRVNEIVEQTTRQVDQLVEVGKDKISMGQSTAQSCRDVLEKITENASSMANMVSEIAHASKEQAQGVQEINKAISQLDQVTQQNSAVAQQSSTQAEQLRAEAVSLSEAVSNLVLFVTGSDNPESARMSEPAAQRGTSLKSDKVVSMASAKQKLKRGTSEQERSLRAAVSKKAVGSNDAPSNEDPGFEEF